MNKYLKILCIIFLLFSFKTSIAQKTKNVELGLSVELLNGKSWGGVESFSSEINYLFNKDYSVSGLFRHGGGFSWYGAVDHKPEMYDDISVYNEISTYLNYNFDNSALGLYLGGGIGIIWGIKENEKNYFMPQIPLIFGSKVQIIDGIKFGLKFIGNISTKITFTGIGLHLIFEI